MTIAINHYLPKLAAMLTAINTTDLVISGLLIIGILQLALLSTAMLRKGIPPEAIQQMIPALFTIWIVIWPVYMDAHWLWLGSATLASFSLLSWTLPQPFWKQLRTAWRYSTTRTIPGQPPALKLPPLTPLIIAFAITTLWFQSIPEFGFGLALSLCLAFPAAHWVDHISTTKLHIRPLGFPAQPQQTLAGHLLFITTSTLLLSWSLQVYHGTDWRPLIIATLLAALASSATRALIPGQWFMPAAMLTTGFVMWLL